MESFLLQVYHLGISVLHETSLDNFVPAYDVCNKLSFSHFSPFLTYRQFLCIFFPLHMYYLLYTSDYISCFIQCQLYITIIFSFYFLCTFHQSKLQPTFGHKPPKLLQQNHIPANTLYAILIDAFCTTVPPNIGSRVIPTAYIV